MFVRLKTRRLEDEKGEALYFVLAETKRVAGKPRQRSVRYLGSIRFLDGVCAPLDVVRFWIRVDKHFENMAVGGIRRAQFEGSIARRVPRPNGSVQLLA